MSTGFFTREQILAVQAPAQAIVDLKTILTGSGFSNVTDWVEGTYQFNLLQLAAFLFTTGQARAATVILNSVETTASGSFLTVLSDSFFDNQRFPGSQTVGNMVLSTSTGAGPISLAPGQLKVQANGTLTYSNQSNLSIPSALTAVTAAFVADNVGQDYNLPPNQSIVPVFSLPGLSVTNPPLPHSTTWVTSPGADAESDQALHVRNQTKWSTLATAETPPDRVIYTVVSASGGAISDVQVDTSNPHGPGTIAVYCSTLQSPAPAGEVAAITPIVQSVIFNGTALCTVTSSTAVAFGKNGNNNPLQVWYAPGSDLPTLSSSMVAALNGWIASVPTGGNDYAGSLLTPGSSGIADVDGLIAVLYNVPGVRKVKISNQADIELAPFQKLTAPLVDPVTDMGMWPGVVGSTILAPGAIAFGPQNNMTASIFS